MINPVPDAIDWAGYVGKSGGCKMSEGFSARTHRKVFSLALVS